MFQTRAKWKWKHINLGINIASKQKFNNPRLSWGDWRRYEKLGIEHPPPTPQFVQKMDSSILQLKHYPADTYNKYFQSESQFVR